jgi:hypothetical protein
MKVQIFLIGPSPLHPTMRRQDSSGRLPAISTPTLWRWLSQLLFATGQAPRVELLPPQPDLESGNMVFMMSKSAYLYDAGDHNGPHLMFFTALKDGKDWGADEPGSPVVSGPYWFLSSKEPSQAKGLPPILVFAVEVAKWSDGTVVPMHQE